MPLLTCPRCDRLTTSDRAYCIYCDVRLPVAFGILIQPNPQSDMDTMLRTTLLQVGRQAAIWQWLDLNANGGLDEAKAHIQRLTAALPPGQRPPA